jgi:hypothetical protein
MIRKNYLIATLLVLFLPIVQAANYYNSPVYVIETAETVIFYGTVDMASDPTGNIYTQAFQIDDCNQGYSFLGAYTNAQTNDDVNIHVQYNKKNAVAGDTAYWKAGLNASGKILDDVHDGVVQCDTVNVTTAVEDKLFNASSWCRFYFAGQTGNPSTTDVYWFAVFKKSEINYRPRNQARVKSTQNVN